MAIEAESTVFPMRRTKRVDPVILEYFGRKLEEWVREEHEDNQSSAGRALGLSQGHISAMIQGHRGPGLPTLIELARISGKPIDWWLGLERTASREDRILAEFAELKADVRALRSDLPPLPVKGSPDAPRPRRR